MNARREPERIACSTGERHRVGEIGEMELVESQVERDQFEADMISAEANVVGAYLVLGQVLGKPECVVDKLPVAALDLPVRAFDVGQLVAKSLERRADLLSKQRALKAADLRIELANVRT